MSEKNESNSPIEDEEEETEEFSSETMNSFANLLHNKKMTQKEDNDDGREKLFSVFPTSS